MDLEQKKTALRMIPYGLYVLTGETKDGRVGAATVNWITQASFEPPLLAAAVKVGSTIHGIIKEAGAFAVNVLGKDQQTTATMFFKHREREGNSIGGEAFRTGSTGAPIFESVPAYLECSVVEIVDRGDHSIFVGEVVDAGASQAAQKIEGRADSLTLLLKDLGDKVYYGG